MATCITCGLDADLDCNQHYECAQYLKAGRSEEAIRTWAIARQKAEREGERADFIGATKTQISLAGWLVPCYIIAGLSLGYSAAKDDTSAMVLAVVGGIVGLLFGIANLTRRKIEALTARKVSEYIASKQ